MTEKKHTEIYIAYDDHEGLDPSEPEKELLLAILTAALSDLKNPGKEAKRAMEYLLNPEDDYIFSFRSICDYLNIDPQQVLASAGLKKKRGNRDFVM